MLNLNAVQSNVQSTEAKEERVMDKYDDIIKSNPPILTNKDSKISTIVAVLFKQGLTPQDSVTLAAALMDTQDQMLKGAGKWAKRMNKAQRNTTLEIGGLPYEQDVVDGWIDTLEDAKLIEYDVLCDSVEPGQFLIDLDKAKEPHYPTQAHEEIVRRKFTKTKTSKCFEDAIRNLEDTMYTVDEMMIKIAERVKAEIGHDMVNHKGKEVFERYVFEGCKKLIADGNVPVISEFFGDTRGRAYQAACHGPNGQASDFARSTMDLHGVHREYNAANALFILDGEIADMHSYEDIQVAFDEIMEIGASQFIIKELKAGQSSKCKKPWSFVKAFNIRIKLVKHMDQPTKYAKPYIGMAFGLDAKCSGPQLGALMTADEQIAAACGFSVSQMDDAYKIATNACIAAGFGEIARHIIKKPYMGIFYGQSAGAFKCQDDEESGFVDKAFHKNMEDINFVQLMEIIKNGPKKTDEKNANAFHAAIEGSFGKMSNLRKAIKDAHAFHQPKEGLIYHTRKATTHLLPDGFTVSMDYKKKYNIFGNFIDFDTTAWDVVVHCGLQSHKFEAMTFKSKDDSLVDYRRTGFVNLIQSVDGLLARLIINHLAQDEGAQHIIAVHDCFRVNINDMIDGKLHRAIQASYMDLFGAKTDEKRGYLRQGTDIVKMYFDGVNDARAHNMAVTPSQFDRDGDRDLDDVLGHEIVDLIGDMKNTLEGTGNSYFFDK